MPFESSTETKADIGEQGSGGTLPQTKRLPRLRDALPIYLGHPDNLIYLLPCLGMVAFTAVQDPHPVNVLWFFAGWLAFLPQEYLSHVFILHFPLPRAWKGEWFYRQMYRMHYGHHDFPRRFDLMFIPLWLTLPLAVANGAVFTWLTHDLYARLMLLSGLFAGYLFFEWSHLFCHLPYQPKTRLGKNIRNRHAWHHHRNERFWYSVSWPALPLDAMGRTTGTLDQVPVSASARFLGIEPTDPRLAACRQRFASRSSGSLECSRLWQNLAQERNRA